MYLQASSNRWLEAIIAVALLGAALLVFPSLRPLHESFLAPKLLVLGVSGAAAALVLAASITDNKLALAGFDLALLGYFVAGALSWVVNPGCTARSALMLATEGAAVLLLFAASRVARDPSGRERIIRVVLAMGVLVAAVALLEILGVALPWQGIKRPYSTLGNRNFVAAQVAIALPFAGARLLAAPGAGRAAVVVLLTLVTVLTRCRSVWLGVLAAGVVTGALYAFVRRQGTPVPTLTPRRWLVAAGVLVAIVVAANIPWPGLHWNNPTPLLSSLQRLVYLKGSGAGRIDQYQIGFAILADHPVIGVGPGNWDDAAAAHAHAAPGNHAFPWAYRITPMSDLVRIATERGLLGLGCFLAALALLGAGALRRARRGDAPAGLTLALLGALVIAAVHGLLDAPLFRPEALALIAVLAGLLRDDRPALAAPLPRPWQRGLLLVAGAVVVGVIGLRTAAVFASQHEPDPVAAQRAALAWFPDPFRAEEIIQIQGMFGRCEPIRDLLARAQTWSPHHWGLWYVASQCAKKRGEEREAADLLAVARQIEPHFDERFGPFVRPGRKPPPRPPPAPRRPASSPARSKTRWSRPSAPLPA